MTMSRTFIAATIALASAAAVLAQEDKPATTNPTTQAAAGPIDYKKLKEMLPETLAGVKRTEATGERSGFGEFKVSTATGSYVKDENDANAPRIDVQIFDYGTNKQMIEGMSIWTKLEVDREGDDGYQKSLKIKDQPAMETYTNEGKTGQLQLLVGNRFLMTVNTTNLPVEQFKKVGEELKLKELAALAK